MTRKQIEKYFVENPSDYLAKKAEYEGCLDGVNLSLKEVVFILSECAKTEKYNEKTITMAALDYHGSIYFCDCNFVIFLKKTANLQK